MVTVIALASRPVGPRRALRFLGLAQKGCALRFLGFAQKGGALRFLGRSQKGHALRFLGFAQKQLAPRMGRKRHSWRPIWQQPYAPRYVCAWT